MKLLRENIIIAMFILTTIFLLSISMITAINLGNCSTSIGNVSNDVINVTNNLNLVSANQVCLTLYNATNITINGNNYIINTTQSSVTTAFLFNDNIKDGIGFNNITIKNLLINNTVQRPVYIQSIDKIDGLMLNNVQWNYYSGTTGLYFITLLPTNLTAINNLIINNTIINMYNLSSQTAIINQASSINGIGNNTNFYFDNITGILGFLFILAGSNTVNYNYENFTFANSNISFTSTNVMQSGWNNLNLLNDIFTANTSSIPFNTTMFQLLIVNKANNTLIYNSIFNNLTLGEGSIYNINNSLRVYNSAFNTNYLNQNNVVKTANQDLYINKSMWINDTGWLPPSYIVNSFYDNLYDNMYHLRYYSTNYPEFVYNFQYYGGMSGGYEYNSSGLFFNENLTYFTNNNYHLPITCNESWFAIITDCVNNTQMLSYLDSNNCGTNYYTPKDNNTILNCTSSPSSSNIIFNGFDVTPIISITIILIIILLVAYTITQVWNMRKK